MRSVAVLTCPGVVAFDLSVPCHVFGLAGYEVLVCGAERSRAGAFDVVAPHGLDAAARADTVLVPGVEDLRVPAAVERALRDAAGRGARMVSICTGAFGLAQAGLLDGRRATTHWRHAAELRERFPRVRVEPDVLYVDEGDLLTSAGVAAGIDLCLHIVRRDRGAAEANRIARRIVVAPHRAGGQAQFVERPVPTAPAAALTATRAWMLERLDTPLTVAAMARHAGYSPRTFARRFRAETGTTPLAWLLSERVLAARRLLEETDLPVEDVARRCGFGTATGLREHFGRACRTTPTAYRASFRAPSTAPGTVEGWRATSTSVRVANPEPPLAA
jgi:transcriptional regulator GlxA family with amidase domain